ncbi:hypothetical protein [Brassicibacter mesophilus]|uniref:hypothetical protein n=1 Tax=Brassicibacter mesophilus TaxID=745119 RepID=UPI003D22FEA0
MIQNEKISTFIKNLNNEVKIFLYWLYKNNSYYIQLTSKASNIIVGGSNYNIITEDLREYLNTQLKNDIYKKLVFRL